MTKSKTDKHLTLSYKKTISKSDLHPLKGVGNGKIDVFKELTPHSWTLRKTLITLLQSLHDMILSLYLKIHSFTQKLTLFA